MVDLIKNKNGVSQILGFVLSLSLTSAVVISAGFLTSSYVDESTRLAAQTQAENIANQVVNLLVNAYITKQQYPNADYSTSIEIPTKLVNHYYYSVKADNNGVQVKSSDNRISVTKTYFDVSEILQMDVNGYIDGSVGKITARCGETVYRGKYDFGPSGSHLVPGYEEKGEVDVTGEDGSMDHDFGSEELGRDFVYGSTPGSFEIKGLDPSKSYSLTFTVGDKDPLENVDDMRITIVGKTTYPPIEISCSVEIPYAKCFISGITPKDISGDGRFTITFEDTSNDYWTICGMTVEVGERTIIVEGGG